MKNKKDKDASLPAIDSFINLISIILTSKPRNNGIKITIANLIARSFIVGLNGSNLIMIFIYLFFIILFLYYDTLFYVLKKDKFPLVFGCEVMAGVKRSEGLAPFSVIKTWNKNLFMSSRTKRFGRYNC